MKESRKGGKAGRKGKEERNEAGLERRKEESGKEGGNEEKE